jgi:hypothetical protein
MLIMRTVTAVFYFFRHAFFFVNVVASGGPRLKIMMILIKTSFMGKKRLKMLMLEKGAMRA